MGDYTCYKKTLPAPLKKKERPSRPPLKGGDQSFEKPVSYVTPL